jgi:predicted fused transcriptional regulator/phosphomethylpyrimidine kinase/predicted transcriptional regulator
MKFIEEVVVEEFLPTFRSLLAEDLRERGLTQSEVGDALGISQSAVSKYVHGEVTRNEQVADDERVQELVARVGEGLATGDLSPVGALVEAEVLVRRLEARGDVLAGLHEAAVPELAAHDGDFRVHDPDSEVRTAERTLASVRRGLRSLENTSGFAGLIPNVGSNLVEALPGAETIADVAGVPGRIFDVKGRPAVPGDPEFGVSEHVATVLLAARAGGSDARAVLNVGYDEQLRDALPGPAAAFDAEAPLGEAVEAAVAAEPGARVVYQTGGFGVEPVLYVLGETAPETAAAVRDVL